MSNKEIAKEIHRTYEATKHITKQYFVEKEVRTNDRRNCNWINYWWSYRNDVYLFMYSK